MAAVALEFRVLDPLEALVDGTTASLGGRRQRAVLAMLLAQCNEVVPAYRLIDGVWDDEPPESAPNVLQGYVSHLRRALGREVIVTRGRDHAIRVADGALDLHRFERSERPRNGSVDAGLRRKGRVWLWARARRPERAPEARSLGRSQAAWLRASRWPARGARTGQRTTVTRARGRFRFANRERACPVGVSDARVSSNPGV
jgi:hypothetical protein